MRKYIILLFIILFSLPVFSQMSEYYKRKKTDVISLINGTGVGLAVKVTDTVSGGMWFQTTTNIPSGITVRYAISHGWLVPTGASGGGGGSMTWPTAAGFTKYSGSSSWSPSIPEDSLLYKNKLDSITTKLVFKKKASWIDLTAPIDWGTYQNIEVRAPAGYPRTTGGLVQDPVLYIGNYGNGWSNSYDNARIFYTGNGLQISKNRGPSGTIEHGTNWYTGISNPWAGGSSSTERAAEGIIDYIYRPGLTGASGEVASIFHYGATCQYQIYI